MTILVTGASGFVGSAVVRHLLGRGYEVRALVRATSDRRNLEGLAVDVAVGDLTDPSSLAAACRGCEGLFHVAADYRLWTLDPAGMFKTNVEGTRNILLAAAGAGVERMVYTSSVATLGLRATEPYGDEETPVTYADMIGPYKRSKYRAEEAVRDLVRDDKLPVVIVNPSTPIGPRDVRPTPTGRMIVEAAAGRMPAYVDTGLNIVHVDDVAAGHVLAYEMGRVGERYILGGENMSLKDIFGIIAALTQRRPPAVRLPHGLILPVAYLAEAWTRLVGGNEPLVTVDGLRMARKKMFFTAEKAKRELGYEARPPEEALADAVAWFGEHGYLG